MLNIKRLSLIALMLLIVGVIGSVLTFKSAHQSDWITKEEVIASGEIENINIITNNTRIEVLPTNDSEIMAELSTKNNEDQLLTEVEGSTLFIQVKDKQRKFVNLDVFSSGSKLIVYIPKKAYDSFQIKADNGYIHVAQIQANDIQVKANNGKIELESIKSSTININSSNGKIILHHVEGDIFGRTNNGSISLITQDLDRNIEFKTDNGKINIQTEQEPTNVTFDVRVGNGKVRIFGESNRDTVIGNGDHIIKLTTSNGGITVTK